MEEDVEEEEEIVEVVETEVEMEVEMTHLPQLILLLDLVILKKPQRLRRPQLFMVLLQLLHRFGSTFILLMKTK